MPRRANRNAGFTLLEVLIASTLLGVVLGMSLMVTLSGRGALNQGMIRARAAAKARRAQERVVNELRSAGIDGLTPAINPNGTTWTSTLTYDAVEGVAGGAPIWGASTRIARAAAPEDPDDGVDNDSDGLVDEGVLLLTRDVGGLGQFAFVLCTNVPELFEGELLNGLDDNGNGLIDESGFHIQRIGTMLTVRLCVQEAGGGGTSERASVVTSVTLRN